MTHKPETYFIDVDGVILRHWGAGASVQWAPSPPGPVDSRKRLPGVLEFLDDAERRGCRVVLVTARKECCRADLERTLMEMGVFWDALVMGVTSGQRVIINDAKPDGSPACAAITLPRNEGLGGITL